MSDCSTKAFKVPKPELKPCPFCGGKADGYTVKSRELFTEYVHCERCNACTDVYESKQEAIEAWNTRYQPTCSYKEGDRQYYRCTNCGYEAHYYEYLPDEGEFCKGCGARVEKVD